MDFTLLFKSIDLYNYIYWFIYVILCGLEFDKMWSIKSYSLTMIIIIFNYHSWTTDIMFKYSLNCLIPAFAEMTRSTKSIKIFAFTQAGRSWGGKWRKYLRCTFSYICVRLQWAEQSWEMNLLLGKHLISKSNSGSRDLYNMLLGQSSCCIQNIIELAQKTLLLHVCVVQDWKAKI